MRRNDEFLRVREWCPSQQWLPRDHALPLYPVKHRPTPHDAAGGTRRHHERFRSNRFGSSLFFHHRQWHGRCRRERFAPLIGSDSAFCGRHRSIHTNGCGALGRLGFIAWRCDVGRGIYLRERGRFGSRRLNWRRERCLTGSSVASGAVCRRHLAIPARR